MKKRFLFTQKHCAFCPYYFPEINRVNANLMFKNLPIIKIKEMMFEDEFGMKLEKHEFNPEGTPTLYVDGILVEGMTSKYYVKGFLEGLKEFLKEK